MTDERVGAAGTSAGIFRLNGNALEERDPSLRERLGRVARHYRYFLALVVAPTLLVACYYYLFASDQYEARADFIVKKADSPAASVGVGQLLGMSLGSSAVSSEAHLVSEYLLSHDAVERLREEDQLVERYRRPHIDWISRLWFSNPTPEKLLSYYEGQVAIDQDIETGISHLSVHAFTPEDAYEINRKLLLLGEEQINKINERTFRDRIASSEAELKKAEADMLRVQRTLTAFRRAREDINPEGSGEAQISLVTELTSRLVSARARLQAMRGVISVDSPQYRAAQSQVRALESQVAAQSDRIAGTEQSIATSLGDYESLLVERENTAKRYAALANQYEQSLAEAARKQVYLIRVVDTNMPVKSLFPERGRIVLTVFLSLGLIYAIGWMLLAGVKEHNI